MGGINTKTIFVCTCVFVVGVFFTAMLFTLTSCDMSIVLDPTKVNYSPLSYLSEPEMSCPDEYSEIVNTVCEITGMSKYVLIRVIWQESRWDKDCISYNEDSKDLGICQFNSKYLDWFSEKYGEFDPFIPEQAIYVAARHLMWLYEQTGTWGDAVAAWNCGLTRWATGEWPDITVRHVAKVLDIPVWLD